jgi:hypothetical protein
MPNEAYGGGIYLNSLILSRHWGLELRKGLDLGEDSDGLRRERTGVE